MPTTTGETKYGPQPIRVVLFERGIAGTEFADRIGISRLHVSKVNRGHILPSPAYLDAACAELSLPADRLFTQDVINGAYYRGAKRSATVVTYRCTLCKSSNIVLNPGRRCPSCDATWTLVLDADGGRDADR